MVLAEPSGTSFLDVLRGRTDHILDACTRCGKCLEACPMIELAGLGSLKPKRRCQKRVKPLSKLILDFGLAKDKSTVEFREGS
jgi:ferredoxin